MTLNDTNKAYNWEYEKEDDRGYYFVLFDNFTNQDYNVVLVKDNGNIMVNGGYIDTFPNSIAQAIQQRVDYFMTCKNCIGGRACGRKYNHDSKRPEKKEENKPEKKNEKKGK